MKLINRNVVIVMMLLFSIVNSYGQDPVDPGIDPGTPVPISDYYPYMMIVAIVLGFIILRKKGIQAA